MRILIMVDHNCSSGPGEDEGQCQASLEVCLAKKGGGGGGGEYHQGKVNEEKEPVNICDDSTYYLCDHTWLSINLHKH